LSAPAAQPEDEKEVREPPARPIFGQPVIVPNEVGLGLGPGLGLGLKVGLRPRARAQAGSFFAPEG
jgi:hypothetical protein